LNVSPNMIELIAVSYTCVMRDARVLGAYRRFILWIFAELRYSPDYASNQGFLLSKISFFKADYKRNLTEWRVLSMILSISLMDRIIDRIFKVSTFFDMAEKKICLFKRKPPAICGRFTDLQIHEQYLIIQYTGPQEIPV
jgi:hypothetical protein